MSFYGVQLTTQVNKLIFEIRLHLSRNKYTPNLRTIYRSFVDYDPQVSGKILPHQFQHAMNVNGVFFKKYELQVIQKAFGVDGRVNWFQFLGKLRQPMGPLRRQLVEHIFDSMDKDKKGSLSTEKLMQHFNPNELQIYKMGKKTLQEVKTQLLLLFAVVNNEITRQEFIAFYDDNNINFPHNDIFVRFVSNFWHYTPEKQNAVKEELIKTATKSLRFKLIEKSQGTKDQLLIRKLFQQFDQNGNFYLSPYDLDCMMKKLGVEANRSVVEIIHQRIDKNNSGYIEFEQFKKFLYYDPYPY